jgi:hypothetical protein
VGALAGAALALVVAGAASAVPLLRRAQSRRRLRHPDPVRRVAGAWLEVMDALRLAGRPAGAHLAATEVAAHARTAVAVATPAARDRATVADAPPAVRAPVPALEGLAQLVNATAFGDAPPDPRRAGLAEREALAYVAELRARQRWRRRLLWSVHPGPLRWHR